MRGNIYNKILKFFSIIIIVLYLILSTNYLVLSFPDISKDAASKKAIYFILFVNFNISILTLLLFGVGRNILKLVRDRKKGAIGSLIQSRLILALVGTSFIPTLLMFLIAQGLVKDLLSVWLSTDVKDSLKSGLHIVQYVYDEERRQLVQSSKFYKDHIIKALNTKTETQLIDSIKDRLERDNIREFVLFNSAGMAVVHNLSEDIASNPSYNFKKLYELVQKSKDKINVYNEGSNIQYCLLISYFDNQYLLVLTKVIPEKLYNSINTALKAYDNQERLSSFSGPIASSYELTLAVITLCIVFIAIWFGFYLARRLAIPMQNLARGTIEVGRGNLNYRVDEVGDSEMRSVIRSFNQMVEELSRLTNEIQKVERSSAWSEVARRIAHEFKNPLTPIQLSAQRIIRKYAPMGSEVKGDLILTPEDRIILKDCVSTIITQVESLRKLLNEFSKFSRMPKVNLSKENLNEILSEIVGLYAHSHSNIVFNTTFDSKTPLIPLDKEAFSRVIINLLDNSIIATENEQAAIISVITKYDDEKKSVTIVLSDNGVGFNSEVKSRLFEPYFSTKTGGTGLGLSIASSVVTDHHGFIKAENNYPKGAKFIIGLSSE